MSGRIDGSTLIVVVVILDRIAEMRSLLFNIC